MQHPWSDAWLFASIMRAVEEGEPSLERVIAWGDMYNKAIFTRAELAYGTARLQRAGLFIFEDGRFRPVGEAQQIWSQIERQSSTGLEQIEGVQRAIGAETWQWSRDPNAADPKVKPASISRRDIELSFERYREWFKRAMGRR